MVFFVGEYLIIKEYLIINFKFDRFTITSFSDFSVKITFIRERKKKTQII